MDVQHDFQMRATTNSNAYLIANRAFVWENLSHESIWATFRPQYYQEIVVDFFFWLVIIQRRAIFQHEWQIEEINDKSNRYIAHSLLIQHEQQKISTEKNWSNTTKNGPNNIIVQSMKFTLEWKIEIKSNKSQWHFANYAAATTKSRINTKSYWS